MTALLSQRRWRQGSIQNLVAIVALSQILALGGCTSIVLGEDPSTSLNQGMGSFLTLVNGSYPRRGEVKVKIISPMELTGSSFALRTPGTNHIVPPFSLFPAWSPPPRGSADAPSIRFEDIAMLRVLSASVVTDPVSSSYTQLLSGLRTRDATDDEYLARLEAAVTPCVFDNMYLRFDAGTYSPSYRGKELSRVFKRPLKYLNSSSPLNPRLTFGWPTPTGQGCTQRAFSIYENMQQYGNGNLSIADPHNGYEGHADRLFAALAVQIPVWLGGSPTPTMVKLGTTVKDAEEEFRRPIWGIRRQEELYPPRESEARHGIINGRFGIRFRRLTTPAFPLPAVTLSEGDKSDVLLAPGDIILLANRWSEPIPFSH